MPAQTSDTPSASQEKSLRIGIVTGEYPPMQGGVGAHCRLLAQTLIQQGHSVSVFSDHRAASDDADIALDKETKRWRYGTMRKIKNWAKREHLDLVNLHYQTAAYRMSPWIHFMPDILKPVPVITTFHDLRFPYLFPKAGRLRDWIVMRLAKASSGVITTNHEDAEVLKHLPHHQLIPIGSSVSIDLPDDFDWATWRNRSGAASDEFLVGHFGFMNHSKGIDTLLEAVTALDDAVPVKLLMIGGRTGTSDRTNASYADWIDRRIAELGLADRVCWTGFVDDKEVSAYMAVSDILALPFRDGASYRRSSLMAVIHNECAILTTKPRVDIPTFASGENLMMVTPENTHALAAALQVLYKKPTIRASLRQGAVALRAHFAWDKIAADNAQFFHKVMERG